MSDNMFSEDNIPQSAWFKFDNVGDVCKGTLVEVVNKPAEGNFPPQTVYRLVSASTGTAEIVDEMPKNPKLEEVGELSVGISKSYVNDRLKSAKVGDKIGFAFIKTVASKTKGNAPAKSILPFNGGVDQEYMDSLGVETSEAEDVFK